MDFARAASFIKTAVEPGIIGVKVEKILIRSAFGNMKELSATDNSGRATTLGLESGAAATTARTAKTYALEADEDKYAGLVEGAIGKVTAAFVQAVAENE